MLDRRQVHGRPRTRIESARAQPDFVYRLVVGESVRLWVWVDDWWEDYVFVRPQNAVWTPLLEPIDAGTVRAAQDWLWFMRERLEASPLNPMYAARFRLESVSAEVSRAPRRKDAFSSGRPASPHVDALDLSLANFWNEDWRMGPTIAPGALLPLRHLASEDEGRLKWWRKVARSGQLPPVLTWYVQVLEKHIVLDGHVRLRAALDEGVALPVVQLWQEGMAPPRSKRKREAIERGVAQLLESTPGAVSKANTMLQEAYGGRVFATQRRWPVPGGVKEWLSEMRSSLPRLDEVPDWVPRWLEGLERASADS